MSKKIRKVIEWAAREKRRAVNQAVGKNFLKSITEPITNSDSALKNLAGIPHAAGLIDRIVDLTTGERIDTSALKGEIAKRPRRQIILELATAGRNRGLCRIIDAGPGMSATELEAKFGLYAEAKAKGEKTRSLFGRGALDVLLYHEDSVIYSVKDGILSSCRIFWDKDSVIDIDEIGKPTAKILAAHNLPSLIQKSGTVVQFRLKEGTSIPLEDQIVDKISRFYMLRLIAADPNTEVIIRRTRAGGHYENPLLYDFPIGNVLGRFRDNLNLGSNGSFPIDILVARSDQPLQTDPTHIDRRENGLLFVDENDAVLDLTLLPEYDKNPYLLHVFGIVRIAGIRSLLEAKLEAEEAVAVLTVEREGFNRKHEITEALFSVVEKHVKPLYLAEEKRQKKGDSTRSDLLNERIRDVLKAINDFNKEETEEEGVGLKDRDEPILFSVNTIQLYTGVGRNVSVFVNSETVKAGEIVLFESDNPEIKIEPDSETARHRKGQKYQRIRIKLSCDVKGQTGELTALTLEKDGKEAKAKLKVLGVDDPPVFEPPEDIEFAASHFTGHPNRSNKAALLVNLKAFTGMPEITFWLEEKLGNVSLGEESVKRLQIKVSKDMISEANVARVGVPFNGTGWGQRAVLRAKAKSKTGNVVHARCKVSFERPKGKDKFSDFYYEDLRRNVLGDVADDRIYINAGYKPHREIFGSTEEEFNKQLETNPVAQMRAATVLVETVVHHTASVNYGEGGNKGWQIEPTDPVTSFRTYLDERRMKLEPPVLRAIAPDLSNRN